MIQWYFFLLMAIEIRWQASRALREVVLWLLLSVSARLSKQVFLLVNVQIVRFAFVPPRGQATVTGLAPGLGFSTIFLKLRKPVLDASHGTHGIQVQMRQSHAHQQSIQTAVALIGTRVFVTDVSTRLPQELLVCGPEE